MIWIKLLSCSTGNKSSLTTNGFVRVAEVSNRPAKLLWGIFYYHNPHQRNAIAKTAQLRTFANLLLLFHVQTQ